MNKIIIFYITVEHMQFARLATNAANLVAIVTKRSALAWKKRKIVSKKGCGFHNGEGHKKLSKQRNDPRRWTDGIRTLALIPRVPGY